MEVQKLRQEGVMSSGAVKVAGNGPEEQKAFSQASDEYSALYQRITSQTSRRAADALFSAGSEDLRQSYQPGRTENT